MTIAHTKHATSTNAARLKSAPEHNAAWLAAQAKTKKKPTKSTPYSRAQIEFNGHIKYLSDLVTLANMWTVASDEVNAPWNSNVEQTPQDIYLATVDTFASYVKDPREFQLGLSDYMWGMGYTKPSQVCTNSNCTQSFNYLFLSNTSILRSVGLYWSTGKKLINIVKMFMDVTSLGPKDAYNFSKNHPGVVENMQTIVNLFGAYIPDANHPNSNSDVAAYQMTLFRDSIALG